MLRGLLEQQTNPSFSFNKLKIQKLKYFDYVVMVDIGYLEQQEIEERRTINVE